MKCRYLDEVLPLLLACADGLLDAPQLVEDGLSLVQLVVCLTAGHLPVDPVSQTHTLGCVKTVWWICKLYNDNKCFLVVFDATKTLRLQVSSNIKCEVRRIIRVQMKNVVKVRTTITW